MSICNWVLHSHLFTDFFWSLVDFYGSLYLLQKEEFWQKKKNEWQGQPLSIGIRICIQKQLDALLYSLWSPQWEVFVWVYTIKHEFASTTWALCLGRGLFITQMRKWHCFISEIRHHVIIIWLFFWPPPDIFWRFSVFTCMTLLIVFSLLNHMKFISES